MDKLTDTLASASIADLAGALTAVLTLLTLFAIYRQIKYAALTYSADHVSQVRAQYDSPYMQELRRAAATSILHTRKNDVSEYTAEMELFDFFEDIGFKVRIGLINKRMTFQTFGRAIPYYYWGQRELIRKMRQSSPSVWGDFVNLAEDFEIMERIEMLPRLLRPIARPLYHYRRSTSRWRNPGSSHNT